MLIFAAGVSIMIADVQVSTKYRGTTRLNDDVECGRKQKGERYSGKEDDQAREMFPRRSGIREW